MSKKQIAKILLALGIGASVAVSGMGLAACTDGGDDDGHDHVYSKYVDDENGTTHHKECPDDGDVEKNSTENHVWGADDKCEKCEAEKPVESGDEITSITATMASDKKTYNLPESGGVTISVSDITVKGSDNNALGSEWTVSYLLKKGSAEGVAPTSGIWTVTEAGDYSIEVSATKTGLTAPLTATITGITVNAYTPDDPGPGDDEDETTTVTVAEADFTTMSAGAFNAGTTGFTLKGSDALRAQGNKSNWPIFLNLNGTGTTTNHSLEVTVPNAGKVEITATYANSNTGRYLDIFTEDGTVLGTGVKVKTSGNLEKDGDEKFTVNLKTITITVWTTADNTKLYIGSHNSGIELGSVKVESTYSTKAGEVYAPEAPVADDFTVVKGTKSYTLVNADVEVKTDDITIYTDEGTTPEGFGYTVAYSVTGVTDNKVTAPDTYTLAITASKASASDISLDINDISVAYPTNTDLTTSFETYERDLGESESTVTFAASELGLQIAGVTPDTESVWTITYTIESDTNTSWSLAQGTHTLSISATRETGVSLTKDVTINVNAYVEKETAQITDWSTYSSTKTDTVVLQDSQGGSIFKVTLVGENTNGTRSNSSLSGDPYLTGDGLNFTGNGGKQLLKFELAEGYTYTITVYAGSTSSGSRRNMSLNGVQKSSGDGDALEALIWTIDGSEIDETQIFALTQDNGNARIGSVLIEAIPIAG